MVPINKIIALTNENQLAGYHYNRGLFDKAGIKEPPKT
jgi:ABC-type glycerol-3-phosphate transport system substrate-binding protein